MSDPKRLLDDPEASDEERRLLDAGAAMAPPSALGADVWAGLASKLPGAGPAGGSSQAAPSGSAASSTAAGGTALAPHAGLSAVLLKGAVTLLAVGALVLVGRAWLPSAPAPSASALPPPPSAAVSAPETPAIAPLAEAAPALPPPSAAVAPPSHASAVPHASKVAPHVAVAPSSSASDASEESRVVAAARDALRSGNSAGALALLNQAQQRFGSGVLGQEREALTIEALAKSGQHAAARTRGEAFLKSFANSPYAARIRALIGS